MILKIGDKGPQVMHLQSALKALGIGLPKYGVDGIFGPETQAAVKQAQQQLGLPTSGTADEVLLSRLGINQHSLQVTPKSTLPKTALLALGIIAIIGIGIAIKQTRQK
ncbi:peptidoglycan-binding protein [Aliifodinibius sp. S!AR15-10]|uniref:peptidoglycan-binding domain-containing protein n=1 Tax=Aliifodinibius sp. S!AR15-10 TaxID=2950437 RepID=UPI00285C84C8|nr:peptidoglycan-binding protein [Aliifodinibius sp. S!AR15-10]MDR8389997.1 peptidoglycan-binding protein [Aliifodinibius sp. S!AR15-10]